MSLKTADDLFDSKPSPRTESMVAAAVQWAERIMRKWQIATECWAETQTEKAAPTPT